MTELSSSLSVSGEKQGAVFFDAVHTLFDMHPDYAGSFALVARDFGHPVAVSEVEKALAPLLADLDRRKRSPDGHVCSPESLYEEWMTFNAEVFRSVGINGDVTALSKEMERRFDSGEYATVYPGAFGILDTVRSMGYVTGIISNGTAGMENCLKVLGLSDRVDVVLVSALVGYEKPAPEIFRKAESLVGQPPDRCLLIGDHYWADVAGALRAGWKALWLNPRGKAAPETCEEIRSLGEVPDRLSGLH